MLEDHCIEEIEMRLSDLASKCVTRFQASIDERLAVIRSALELEESLALNLIWRDQTPNSEFGMNTLGILFDRMTILICKAALSASPGARERAREQLKGLRKAIHGSGLPSFIVLEKEATERQTSNHLVERELVSLQYANLGMWVNQDILYTEDVNSVLESRLRSYIYDFSFFNRIRNISIERIDRIASAKFGGVIT